MNQKKQHKSAQMEPDQITEQRQRLTPEQLKAIKKAKEKIINSGKIVNKNAAYISDEDNQILHDELNRFLNMSDEELDKQ